MSAHVSNAILCHLLTVVDRRNFARRTAENLRLPRVKMTVEMDDGHRPIGAIHAAEQRQSDRVVTAHSDHTWEGLVFLRKPRLVGVSGRVAHEDAVVAFFDLVDGPFRIVRSDRNIAAVDDRSPAVEWVGGERNVVASTIALRSAIAQTLTTEEFQTYYKLRRRLPCLIPCGPKRAPGL